MTDGICGLGALERLCAEIPNTRLMALAKINAIALLSMNYERQIALIPDLAEHPHTIFSRLVKQAIDQINSHRTAEVFEADRTILAEHHSPAEEMHQALFQQLWSQFSRERFISRIDRADFRLRNGDLGENFFAGIRCIDLGCGHGNMSHAMVRMGAAYALGIDYGETTIKFAQRAAAEVAPEDQRIEFKIANVYATGESGASYDFAMNNGVFHHLDDPETAYREAYRVLKPCGFMWIYTDGTGGIYREMWDVCRRILQDVPRSLIVKHLEYLGLDIAKRNHLGDKMIAYYRHDTWEGLTSLLTSIGFGNFKLLSGGVDTDWDHEALRTHKYGAEKFGTGEFRFICQKLPANRLV